MDIEIFKDVVLAAVTGVCAVAWYGYLKIKSDVETLNKDSADFKLYVANNYINRLDLSEAMSGIKESMAGVAVQLNSIQLDLKDFTNRFSDKLDRKQDKP